MLKQCKKENYTLTLNQHFDIDLYIQLSGKKDVSRFSDLVV